MAYRLKYSDYSTTASGPPDPAAWMGPPGPPGPQGVPGPAPLGAPINVLDHGADPTGVADSAPAFRACMGSNRVVIVPAGTYLFNSLLAIPSPYIALMPPCVLAQGLTNFVISGYGATIKLGTGGNRSTVFIFDRCSNFEVMGLTIEGNRVGLGTTRATDIAPHSIAADPNVGVAVMSGENFALRDLHMTGVYVYCIQGDWWVNGLVQNIVVDGSIYGFDLAYLYRCVFDNCRLIGSDTLGTGATHVGNGGFSCIVDPSNAPYNYTTIPTASFTSYTTYRNNSATNFNTGWYATTGRHHLFQGNRWFANPGSSGNAGIGVFFGYDAVSGVGAPISNCVVAGDTFAGNGTNVAGQGIRFANPSGSDFTSDITIANCQFDNNTNTGVGSAPSTTNIRRLQAIGNAYTGAAQTTDIAAGLAASFTAIVGRGSGTITLAGSIGINGSPAPAKPTVSGAKGSNAALASLMTALTAYGLVTDTTTA